MVGYLVKQRNGHRAIAVTVLVNVANTLMECIGILLGEHLVLARFFIVKEGLGPPGMEYLGVGLSKSIVKACLGIRGELILGGCTLGNIGVTFISYLLPGY